MAFLVLHCILSFGLIFLSPFSGQNQHSVLPMIPSESWSVMKSLEQGCSFPMERSSNHRWITCSRNISQKHRGVRCFLKFQCEELSGVKELSSQQLLHVHVSKCLHKCAANQLLSELDIDVSCKNATLKKKRAKIVFPFLFKIKVHVKNQKNTFEVVYFPKENIGSACH